jgi:hypothetical protein
MEDLGSKLTSNDLSEADNFCFGNARSIEAGQNSPCFGLEWGESHASLRVAIVSRIALVRSTVFATHASE